MKKFNEESIMELRDEPLKKSSSTSNYFSMKENQNVENVQFDVSQKVKFIEPSSEKKGRFKRSVLRREAEKPSTREVDLLWNPSLHFFNSTLKPQPPKLHQPTSTFNENQTDSYDWNSNSSTSSQFHSQSAIAFELIDEVVDIATSLGKNPSRFSIIDKVVRLLKNPNFSFGLLSRTSCPPFSSLCQKLTTNMIASAEELIHRIDAQNQDINSLFQVINIFHQVVEEAKQFNVSGNNEKKCDRYFDLQKLRIFLQKCIDFSNKNRSISKKQKAEFENSVQNLLKNIE